MALITVDWLTRASDIPASIWDECFRPPVEGRWWYETLEHSGLDSQFKIFYGLVRRAGSPIAIVPAFAMDVPIELVAPTWTMPVFRCIGRFIPAWLYQPTFFVGSPCSDEGTVGIVRGVLLSEIAHAIHEAVEIKASQMNVQMVVWKDFPQQDESALMQLSARAGLFPSLSYPGTVVSLTGDSLDDYYKSLKSSHRHNLKKKLKRSNEKAKLTVSVEQRPSSETLDEIWGLFWQTYQKGETKFEKLTPKFFSLIAEKDASWFVTLREQESSKMVAFMLCFKIGDRVINKFVGMDYKKPADWFLYFRLWDRALDWTIRSGAKEFQSGQTGYRGKIDVGHSLVPLINYCRNRNPFAHEIYRRVGPTILWSELDRDLSTYIQAHPEAEFKLPWKVR